MRFGIEIEFHIPAHCRDAIIAELEYKLNARDTSYTHLHRGNYDRWTFHRDGSLRDCNHHVGLELVSPIIDGSQLEQFSETLNYVMESIRNKGGFVNRQCGFHIHVSDTRVCHHHLDSINEMWMKYQSQFIDCIPNHRKNNRYCKPNELNMSGSRYRMLNLVSSYERTESIEFRLFQGTLNPMKAMNMIKSVLAFTELAVNKITANQVNHSL